MAAMNLLVGLFFATVVAGGQIAGAQVVHDVFSDDRTSDMSKDIVGSWSSGRIYRVGDHLLFRYLSPDDTIVELASIEEYHSCDLTNPIKMYTDEVNKVALEEEGIRYFASASYEKCKNGQKLPVHVTPGPHDDPPPASPPPHFHTPPPATPPPHFDAPPPAPPPPHFPDAPPAPSSATQLYGIPALIVVFIGLVLF